MTQLSPDLFCLCSCPMVHLKIGVDFCNECLGFDATMFTLIIFLRVSPAAERFHKWVCGLIYSSCFYFCQYFPTINLPKQSDTCLLSSLYHMLAYFCKMFQDVKNAQLIIDLRLDALLMPLRVSVDVVSQVGCCVLNGNHIEENSLILEQKSLLSLNF